MKANPDYMKTGDTPVNSPSNQSSGKANDSPLAVVCSMADIESATKLQAVTSGTPMQLSQQTSETIMNMQEEEFLEAFQSPEGVELDGGEIIDKLSEYFIQYEVHILSCVPACHHHSPSTNYLPNVLCTHFSSQVPMGLLSKLMDLRRYRLNFLVDDSGSMRAPTDVNMSEGVPHMLRGQQVMPGMFMTRWQEGECEALVLEILLLPPPCVSSRFVLTSSSQYVAITSFHHASS